MDAVTGAERGIWLDDPADREDLSTFADRAQRLDDAAVVRLRARPAGGVVAWFATGFDVLASRVVDGRIRPADLCAGADQLQSGLGAVGSDGYVDPGFPMDSAWRGALPPDTGFVHLDDVPARAVLDLAHRGSELVKEHSSAHGPPASLLDQEVVGVSAVDVSLEAGAFQVKPQRLGIHSNVDPLGRQRVYELGQQARRNRDGAFFLDLSADPSTDGDLQVRGR